VTAHRLRKAIEDLATRDSGRISTSPLTLPSAANSRHSTIFELGSALRAHPAHIVRAKQEIRSSMSIESLEGARYSMPADPSIERIRTVTGRTFDLLVLQGVGPIAVEFMSYGCGHCRLIEPVLQQVAEMVRAKEKVFRVNIAVEPALAATYGVQGTPTLIMFLDGREAGRVAGPRPTVSSVLTAVTQPFEG